MNEKEKMLAGLPYNCGDSELLKIWHRAKDLLRDYNSTPSTDRVKLDSILTHLLGEKGKNIWIASPFFCDYGENISIGESTEINYNCVFLDCNRITIGRNVLIGPSVQLYTAFHPLKASERVQESKNEEKNKMVFCVTQSKEIQIGNHVWIGGGSILLPGVTIGDNSTIGAGSVVVKSIPPNTLAYGNPCIPIRSI